MSLKSRLKQQLGIGKSEGVSAGEMPDADIQSMPAESLEQHHNSDQDMSVAEEVLPENEVGEKSPEIDEEYLTSHEIKFRNQVLDKLLSIMDLARIGQMDHEKARVQILQLANKVILEDNIPVSVASRAKIAEAIEFEILGLGPLEYLLKDAEVSDIMINGSQNVYVERGGRLYRSSIVFNDDRHLMRVIDRIVSKVGRRIDESSPMVDARLNDGSRVNAVIPPLAIDGPSLSIRRFPADPLKLEDLVRLGAFSIGMAELMIAAVKSGKNILISGGTGSGKTTLLNSLSAFIPGSERIVTIEDAAELQLQQSHVVRLETRPPNIEGKGEVSQRDLVRNALRMRPDRIILGEIRGSEALDMLQAMNTGHDGSMSTIHANSPRDALSRVENMVAMAGYDLPVKAVRSQIASALDLVLQIERMEDGGRRMVSLSEIIGMEGEIITMAEIFVFERQGIDDGKIYGRFHATGALPTFMDDLRRRGINLGLDIFDSMAE
jgi:pilus assembly protein CpaF